MSYKLVWTERQLVGDRITGGTRMAEEELVIEADNPTEAHKRADAEWQRIIRENWESQPSDPELVGKLDWKPNEPTA